MRKYFEFSNIGPRKANEDFIRVSSYQDFIFACVADGVGGAGCGDIAAKAAVDYFDAAISEPQADLNSLAVEADTRIKELQASTANCRNMATTLTGCTIEENFLRGVHVGDTRLCVLRGNGIKQLTVSHTEADRLYRAGKLSFSQMLSYPRRNVLESALGISEGLQIQEFTFNLELGDRIILTSDGVHEMLTKAEIRDFSLQNKDVTDFGKAVANYLLSKKLNDNASFIVLE